MIMDHHHYRVSITVALLLGFGGALPAHAQMGPRFGTQPHTWLTGWAGAYSSLGSVRDGKSQSIWVFHHPDFAFGAGIHAITGDPRNGFSIGFEGSYAHANYDRHDIVDTPVVVGSGRARIIDAALSGRALSGGSGGLAIYLTGGVGLTFYHLDDLDRSDRDFTLLAGAGLEYRLAGRLTAFGEWNRHWVYHQKGDMGGNTAHHTQLRGGLRLGF